MSFSTDQNAADTLVGSPLCPSTTAISTTAAESTTIALNDEESTTVAARTSSANSPGLIATNVFSTSALVTTQGRFKWLQMLLLSNNFF